MRFSVILYERKQKSTLLDETEYFAAKICGSLLVLLSFILAGIVYISLCQNIAIKYHEIIMITIATYTFYKVIVAIVKAITQRENSSPLLAVIRTIGYAEASASLLTLQRSMFVSFGSMHETNIVLMNSLTGIAVCLFILLLGIFTILKNSKKGGNDMAQSKLVKTNEKIAKKVVGTFEKIENAVVSGYTKVEDTVVSNYTKVEDAFVERYLTKDDETVGEAKERLKKEQKR